MYSKIGAPTSCDNVHHLLDVYATYAIKPIPPSALALTLLSPKHLVGAQKYDDPIVEHKWTSKQKSPLDVFKYGSSNKL